MNPDKLITLAKPIVELQSLRLVRHSEHDREDVRQDAYLRLLRNAERIDAQERLQFVHIDDLDSVPKPCVRPPLH